MIQLTKLGILLLSLSLVLVGCGQAEKPVVKTAPTAAASAYSLDTRDARPVAQSLSPEIDESQSNAAVVVEFKPPFPQRADFFEPPQRQSTARRDDEHGETVELKGFIFVDEPRAVLSIDGVVSSVPEGGEKYGVQVISIEPPTVVLQRGRNRWPATLE